MLLEARELEIARIYDKNSRINLPASVVARS